MTCNNTPDRPLFVRQQYALAAHIRNPERHPCPQDIEDRRMKIYRELFYNNVEDFMATSYPVLRSITPDDRWHAMIRDYFARHLSQTPLFPEMPREFLKYLEQERGPDPDDPPFMLELAHYEWVELALSILDEPIDERTYITPDNPSDLLSGIPLASPLVWVLSYRFPVHKISCDFLPQIPGEHETHLIVYRNNKDDEVRFIEANPVTARLLQVVIENQHNTGQTLLEQIARELNHPQPSAVISHGSNILQDFQNRTILLGVCSRRCTLPESID